MKHWLQFGILLLLVFFVGCESNEMAMTEPKTTQFKIQLKVPEVLKANEPFMLQGELLNTSNEIRAISHRVDLFSYWIYDEHGKEVLSGLVQYLPLVEFKGELTPNKPYTFDLDEYADIQKNIQVKSLPAGKYKVVTKANFIVNYNGQKYRMDFNSEEVEIIVQ